MTELSNKTITIRVLLIVLAAVVAVFLFDYINHLLIPDHAMPYFYNWDTFMNDGRLEGTSSGAS